MLRKKVRQGRILLDEAQEAYDRYCLMPIAYLDSPETRRRAWEIAQRYNLPTLYDAAFLACIETVPASDSNELEFWTTDDVLVRSLESDLPSYVRRLGTAQ